MKEIDGQKILITGATGFLARYTSEELGKQGGEIIGTTSRSELATTESGLIYLKTTDRTMFEERVAKYKPDAIIHMAALSSPGDSKTNPEAESINYGSVENVVNSIISARKNDVHYNPTLIFYSSVEVHGDGIPGEPITEDTPLDSGTAYARLKIAAEKYIQDKCDQHGINFIIIRQGQTIGVGQSEKFLIPKVVKQIAEIIKKNKDYKGGSGEVETFNTDQGRTLLDARESPLVLPKILRKEIGNEIYMVCGNSSQRLTDVIGILLDIAKRDFNNTIKHRQIEGVVPAQLNRSYDPAKVFRDLGWKAEIPTEDTLRWILYSELKRLGVR